MPRLDEVMWETVRHQAWRNMSRAFMDTDPPVSRPATAAQTASVAHADQTCASVNLERRLSQEQRLGTLCQSALWSVPQQRL